MLHDRTQREGGEELQAAEDQDHPDQQADEERAMGRQGPGRRGQLGLGDLYAYTSATASTAMAGTNRPSSMARPRVVFHQGALAVRPAKAEPLFPVAEV
jgi:hypothetical protein